MTHWFLWKRAQVAATVIACMPTGWSPEPIPGGTSLFLRHPSMSPACAACFNTRRGLSQIAREQPSLSSAWDSPRHATTLHCSQGMQAEDISLLLPSRSPWRPWSGCPEKEEKKKSWPFNHSFNQLFRSKKLHLYRHVAGHSEAARGLIV